MRLDLVWYEKMKMSLSNFFLKIADMNAKFTRRTFFVLPSAFANTTG
jgi:hypothetical protein